MPKRLGTADLGDKLVGLVADCIQGLWMGRRLMWGLCSGAEAVPAKSEGGSQARKQEKALFGPETSSLQELKCIL